MTSGEDRPAPLAGVRVLDVSGPIGAYCTRLLADLGADVVLVEPPAGDALRRQPPFRQEGPVGSAAESLLFAYYHASKRSIVVDPSDETRIAEVGAGADVVVVSPTAATPGWDPATGRLRWAPQAIVCAITPFGLTGPHREWRATPLTSYAMGGGMIRVGAPEGPPLTLPGRHQWDEAGLHAALCILAALQVRESVGPQVIDLSVHEVATMKDFFVETYEVVGISAQPRAVSVGLPPTGTYACADGQINVVAVQVRHWEAFLEMLDHPAALADPALADPLVRRDRFVELRAVIQDLVKDRSRAELVARGQEAGLPCGVVHRPTEFVVDEQVAARGSIVSIEASAGPIAMPGPGFRSEPSLSVPRRAAPAPLEATGTATVDWDERPLVRFEPRTAVCGGPLEGLRVLTFGTFVAGNTTGMLLAELGADVVRIEALARPEVLRTPAYAIGPMVTEPSGVTNTIMQAALSRSMRNLSLDVVTDGGRAVFQRLVARADVVVENFGAATASRWGLSFEALRAVNRRIVLTSLSGYGRSGPRGGYLAYASNISNFVGLTYSSAHNHGTHSDYITAQHAVLGTLAALRSVAATGEGVHVDTAQIEAIAALMPDVFLEALVNGRDVEPPGNVVAGSLLSGAYRCVGHDAWLVVEIEDLADVARLCRLLDVPFDVASEEEAVELRPVLDAALVGWAAERTKHSAARELQRAGLAAGPVQDMEDIWRDPQLWSRNAIVPLDQADFGPHYFAESPHRLGLTSGRSRWAGRRVGQDTTSVLVDWLDLDAAEIASLVASGSAYQA